MLLTLFCESGPRLYVVVGPASGWVTPTAAEIVAGTLAGGAAAAWVGSVAPPAVSGPFTVPEFASGLTPGAEYRAALVWASYGGLTSNVVETPAWVCVVNVASVAPRRADVGSGARRPVQTSVHRRPAQLSTGWRQGTGRH